MKRQAVLLLFLSWFAAIASEPPAATFELGSITEAAQAATRLGDCIAPRFRDTVAGVTVALSLGAAQYGMDLSRPMEISFYSFGEKPAMRIHCHALPNVRDPRDSGRLWGIRFTARRRNGRVVFDSAGVKDPFPDIPPGSHLKSGDLIRGRLSAAHIRQHFQFRAFNTKEPAPRLILGGLDDLLRELDRADLVFSAGREVLKAELTLYPAAGSALAEWMKRTLPPKGKIETFGGAKTLTVLRLNPTETLRRYAAAYLGPGFPAELAAAANGFAVRTSTTVRPHLMHSMRISAGLLPGKEAMIRPSFEKLKETPWHWRQFSRDPVGLCLLEKDRLAVFGADRMDTGRIQAMFEPQEFRGTLPDRPLVCIDLENPEKPLAELRFANGTMRLILQAPDSWIADGRPLLAKPLLLPQPVSRN